MRPTSRIIRLLWVALLFAAPAFGQAGPAVSPGRVVVKNLLDRDLLIWINGEPRGLAGANGEAEFDGVPSGTLSLLASAPGAEGIVASEKRDFAPGRTFVWTIYPIFVEGEEKGTTHLVVRNRLDRTIEIELAGNVAGQIEPGATRTFPGIASGDVTARVRDLEGRLLREFALALLADETMVWEIGAEPTSPQPIPRYPRVQPSID